MRVKNELHIVIPASQICHKHIKFLSSLSDKYIVPMRKIEMVDLALHYEKMEHEIDEAVKRVLRSAAYIKGPEVKEFEDSLREYMKCGHVVSCGNGTDALQIVMMALGLKAGDEIITTNFTFIATVEVVALLGLKLVLVEPEPGTFNISPEAIRRAITPRTKAIVPVHLFGQCADMEKIMEIASANNLYVIEDSAQATGSDYKFSSGKTQKAGTIGIAGTTSFFPSKNLACFGDGGAIFTSNDELAAKMRSIANHGQKAKYQYSAVGINSRLDTIQAAVLNVKLKYLDEFNSARQKVAGYYDKALLVLNDIVLPERSDFSTHIFHQYTIKVKGGKRNALKDHLEKAGIPSMIYYPGPLHMQEAYANLGYRDNEFPVTTSLCSEVLSLPVHPYIDSEQLEHIVLSIKKFFE
jgi:UDP-2-acetamido-2-deoxy-ribo-hexuluronate aminotransferase